MKCAADHAGAGPPARSIGPAALATAFNLRALCKEDLATADATASMPQSITSVSGIADPYVVAVEMQRLRLSFDAEVEVLSRSV